MEKDQGNNVCFHHFLFSRALLHDWRLRDFTILDNSKIDDRLIIVNLL